MIHGRCPPCWSALTSLCRHNGGIHLLFARFCRQSGPKHRRHGSRAIAGTRFVHFGHGLFSSSTLIALAPVALAKRGGWRRQRAMPPVAVPTPHEAKIGRTPCRERVGQEV